VTLIRHRGDHPQAALLEQWLEEVLQIYGDRVLDLDGDAAQIWGRLRVPNPHNAIDCPAADGRAGPWPRRPRWLSIDRLSWFANSFRDAERFCSREPAQFTRSC